ncbi:MAG TPA: DUF1003 domain-containing protein [Candidatus Binataceae bacterium]|nr:DUF1003 domain-containing protein [Candidatus Binataceae bacterium]
MEPAQKNHSNEDAAHWEQRRIRHAHHHPAVKNVNQVAADRLTTGDRIADGFAAMMGSWTFIITQSIVLMVWIGVNIAAWVNHWDPYPFILLNLALSFQAAYAAPIIMMSQNRQSAKDRLMAEQDYEINAKAEEEVKSIMHHLEQQDEFMITILRRLEDNQRLLLAAHKLLDGRAASDATDK